MGNMLCSVAQLCPTLCNPKDCSPLSSSVHGIIQARTLEWVAISFSIIWKGQSLFQQMALEKLNKHMQKCSPSLVDKETYIPLDYIYIWEINRVICVA